MPSLIHPEVPHYDRVPLTQEDLEYADLVVIDLCKLATAAGTVELVQQVRDAMNTQGFFYVVNHGYTSSESERMFDIADMTFSAVSSEEKQAYTSKDQMVYQGYKPRQYWKIEGDVRDQIEHYNINRAVVTQEHPEALRPYLPEIKDFAEHYHLNVLHPILRLLALGLELPEDTLVNRFQYNARGETSVRFMKYYPRSKEEEVKSRNVWLKGHTDVGGVTILWSQPIAALQILSPDGKWQWVKHIDNALVVNIGDAMEFLSGSYYKSTIHRVVQPPADQQGYARVGVFYFCMPDDDVKLAPLIDSPVLQKVAIVRQCPDEDAPTMGAWRKWRTTTYGRLDLQKTNGGHETEIISGIVRTHYN